MTAFSGESDRGAGGTHLPRRPAAFHVGVTGHRALADADHNELLQSVADVLAEVRASASSIVARSIAAEEPQIRNDPPQLRLISSLAAGADSLVAEEALKQGYDLEAPFPFPREVYGDDFHGDDAVRWKALTARASAVLELDGDRNHAAHAYLAAGRVMLDRSDLLMAIWDGKAARGIGGTGQIVREATKRGIPTLVINASPPHSARFVDASPSDRDWRIVLKRVVILALEHSRA